MAADSRKPFPEERFQGAPAALIVVDMQVDFVEPGAPVMADGGLAIVAGINRLISVARRSGTPVIFTHEIHRADGSDYGIELEYDPRHCEEGTEGAGLLPALDVAEGDLHVYKRRYDAFFGTDLDLLLRSLTVKNLVFCGVDTDICVLGSVVSARNHDYRVAVVEDCCAGSSMEAHRAALVCMGTVFGYVVRSTDADRMFPGFEAAGPHS